MKPVLVTTEFRGVFFGYMNGESKKLPVTVPVPVTVTVYLKAKNFRI